MITFLDDYSFYCRVAFLHKKSDAAEAIKAVFWLWLNTTSHSVKHLHIDNGVLQTSFGHISTNSLMIPMVLRPA